MNLTTNPTCLSLRNNAACCIRLCVICVICGRIHTQEDSINIPRRNPRSLPQISQIYADERQVGAMDLLKQMPLISLRKTDAT